MSIFNFDERSKRQPADHALAYATRSDFQRIFTEDMGALHLLALLLTADAAQAERCFVAGLEESIHGNPVFRQWARSWSKRAIIRNAVKLLAPSLASAASEASHSTPGTTENATEKDAWTATIMQLPAFERFVFVMLVLEGYSESDCASLLACTMQELTRARSRALQRVATARQTGSSVRDRRASSVPAYNFA